MQIDRKSTFFLGVFIFIIPFLGFPTFWKAFFTVCAGVLLVLMSVKVSVPRKNSKHKVIKEKVTPVIFENTPIVSPKNDTIEVVMQVPAPEVVAKPTVRKPRAKKINGPTI